MVTAVRSLVTFAFAFAARLDAPSDRKLGAIHLLKLIYLADLAYSRTHGGANFSGISWKFHKLGPYSSTGLAEIEDTLEDLPLVKHGWMDPVRMREFNRYSLSAIVDADELMFTTDKALPAECTSAIQYALRKNGSATSPLLHDVYSSEPMLRAAPGEFLSFVGLDSSTTCAHESHVPDEWPQPSESRKKKLRAAIADRFQRTPLFQVTGRDIGGPYDSEYEEAMNAFEGIVGASLDPHSGILSFDPTVWKSEQRMGPTRDAMAE